MRAIHPWQQGRIPPELQLWRQLLPLTQQQPGLAALEARALRRPEQGTALLEVDLETEGSVVVVAAPPLVVVLACS